MSARVKASDIDNAFQRAASACAAAYSAQPVRQIDGSTLMLCWSGRMDRALDKLAAVRAEGGDVARVQTAVDMLSASARAAMKDAEALASHWATMATAAGQQIDPMQCYPPECQCIGCTVQRQRQNSAIAKAQATQAVYFLLDGTGSDAPRLLSYMDGATDAAQRDLLWKALKRIADALIAYRDAAAAGGEAVDWRGVISPSC